MALIPRLLKPGIGAAAWATVAARAGRTAWRLSRSAHYARHAVGFQQQPAPAVALRMLVAGDGTALGSGASGPEHSVAGLAGAAYPLLGVETIAEPGARLADVLEQLRRASGRYDLVLVQAGGMDVLRQTQRDALQADIERVVRRARELAPQVVLMPCGNLGNLPFFAPPLTWLMAQRSRLLERLLRSVAERHGAQVVGLYREPGADPFVRNPRWLAADGLHPNDAGYACWWQELQKQLPLAQWLAAAR